MFWRVLGLTLALAVSPGWAGRCRGVPDWFLPAGTHRGDTELGDGVITFDVNTAYNAFGASAHRYSIEVSDSPVGGAIVVRPEGGPGVHQPFEVRASAVPYTRGDMGARLVRNGELAKVNRLINEAYPCLDNGPFQASSAFVATFQCVRGPRRKRDTFQVVLATDGNNMYALLNYHAMQDYNIQDPTDQFGIFDSRSGTHHPIALGLGPDEAQNLLQATNGVRRGQWVIDVTGDVPRTPERCAKTPEMCTITEHGSVQSFDGAFLLTPERVKFVVARSLIPGRATGPCDFQVRAVTDKIGELEWVAISLGAYRSRHVKHKRNYAFDRKLGLMEKRGPGGKDIVVSTPVDWTSPDGNTTIQITGDVNSGWSLSSTTCSYLMTYGPNAPEPVLQLQLGADFMNAMEGKCGNYNRVDADDY